ncbi:MAG TPA: phage major capsid protein [Mycobacterium sp.]|nr:phage major capsid protein [Mycobacterium sp.]
MTTTVVENPLISQIRDNRDAKQKEIDDLTGKLTTENRAFTDEEDAAFKAAVAEIRAFDERITELVELDKRRRDADEARKAAGDVGDQRAHVTDAPVYHRYKIGQSYFRDLFLAQQTGDADAADRLRRSALQAQDELAKRTEPELRALGNTGGAGGSGGEFSPPLWLIEDFVAYARPGRKFADSIGPRPLPEGVSSVNLPKITGGTTTAIQTTQNTALSQTDMTTGSISSAISTIGGKQVVAQQLLDQSGIPFDEVVLRDLAADYAQRYGTQVISGSGASGQLNGVYTYFNASGTVNVTFTSASPAVASSTTANSFYSKVFGAASAIETARFMPPDTIWMHPRRWNWILASVDANSRPLVVPLGAAFNPVGETGPDVAQGVVGYFGGLQVITDPNIPTNLGAGTNQDPVFVGIRGDLRLYEGALRLETFREPYADSAGVLFRALAYSAQIVSRYTTSVAVINGTGLVAPTF